jgi:hypothetical protein
VADKFVMSLIALLQTGTCALLLSMQFLVAYGGGFRLLLTPYLLVGLINGFMLFRRQRTPRIIAMIWTAIFVVLVMRIPWGWANPTYRSLVVIALADLLAIGYLSWSVFAAAGKKNWQQGQEIKNGDTV